MSKLVAIYELAMTWIGKMAKQSQNGGDGSTNIQAGTIVAHIGIDEKRAREICREMNLQLRKEYTQEALDIAKNRVSRFEDELVATMEKVDGALEAFADPAFQILLTNAQKAAASTERPVDYRLLSELLMHRFKKRNNRIARAGINLAVEVVDKISDEALLGLTVAHAIASFRPIIGDINKGLDMLDGLFGKVIYGNLPKGMEWLDHLDVLNAVRINSFGSLKKLDQFFSEVMDGYCAVGIKKGSENHSKALGILKQNNLSDAILVDHALNSGYLRLCVSKKLDIDKLHYEQVTSQGGMPVTMSINLAPNQIDAIKSVYDLYGTDQASRNGILEAFRQAMDSRSSLKAVRDWWDSIPQSFQITSAGKVLAHANAQRCDNTLPPLD